MLNPFNTLYEFFKTKRIIFLIFVALIIFSALYLAKQIKLEENITKMLPADEGLTRINKASQEIKFMDKLIFAVSLKDTVLKADSKDLVPIADSLVAKIGPVMTIVVGLLIGFIVLSVFGPMFEGLDFKDF